MEASGHLLGMTRPDLIATYRLQLHQGFGFDDVVANLAYFADLGVSHLYLSPILAAAPGSLHGYDVVDPHRVNDELGGEQGFRRLVAAAKARGLGLVLDIVPNHMAIHPLNKQWDDVLRFGRCSEYASWFDIDWEHGGTSGAERLLLPVLADHYGASIRGGAIGIEIVDGAPMIRAGSLLLPMRLESIATMVREAAQQIGDDDLASVAATVQDAVDSATANPPESQAGDIAELGRMLAAVRSATTADDAAGVARRGALAAVALRLSGDPDELHELLEQQHYRIAHWRTGAEDLDYRRFFDITGLIGIRAEDPAVFASTHVRALDWLARGDIDGLRVDHIDGLADPAVYAATLRAATGDAWIVVEKILQRDEQLPGDWPVDGTTGYETLAVLDRLFVDPDGEAALRDALVCCTGEAVGLDVVRHASKRDVVEHLLPAEVSRLARELVELATDTVDRLDITAAEAEAVITSFLIEFPVYRTYGSRRARLSDAGAAVIAATHERVVSYGIHDPAVVDLVAAMLTEPTGPLAEQFRIRFQQTSGPVMAKGVEDTTFYRYPLLVSLNEVGGDADWFAVSLAQFHERQARASLDSPLRMVATSTHDTKRSEDVRSRISALSEVPHLWAQIADQWADVSDDHRVDSDDDRVGHRDPLVEYLLYQTLLGADPICADRVVAYALKAAREAKRRTSWLQPDADYEHALEARVRAWLADADDAALRTRLLDVVVPAGRVNSLAMKMIALTVPGVPDLYQGSERWTDDLVDPDNRREVDFRARRLALDGILRLPAGGQPIGVLDPLDTGTAKMAVVAATLDVRRRHRDAFAPGTGTYEPLVGAGAAADHLVAFVRGGRVAVLAPRLSLRLRREGGWRDTAVTLPSGRWSDVFTGETFAGRSAVADVFAINPVALLVRR